MEYVEVEVDGSLLDRIGNRLIQYMKMNAMEIDGDGNHPFNKLTITQGEVPEKKSFEEFMYDAFDDVKVDCNSLWWALVVHLANREVTKQNPRCYLANSTMGKRNEHGWIIATELDWVKTIHRQQDNAAGRLTKITNIVADIKEYHTFQTKEAQDLFNNVVFKNGEYSHSYSSNHKGKTQQFTLIVYKVYVLKSGLEDGDNDTKE